MKTWVTSAVMIAGVVGFSASTVHAGDNGKKAAAGAAFAKKDKNGDGFLTREEIGGKKAGAKSGARFAKLDKDKDGKLSKTEIRSVMKKRGKGA